MKNVRSRHITSCLVISLSIERYRVLLIRVKEERENVRSGKIITHRNMHPYTVTHTMKKSFTRHINKISSRIRSIREL